MLSSRTMAVVMPADNETIKNKYPLFQIGLLLSFLGVFIYSCFKYCLSYPIPSDPLEYMAPAILGSTCGLMNYLDRITLAIGLRLYSIIFAQSYMAGAYYIISITVGNYLLGSLIAYRFGGFWGAIFLAIFFNTSCLVLDISSYIYPIQTVPFYAMLAFCCYFFLKENNNILKDRTFWTGFFACLTIFSKITGVGVFLVLLAILLVDKARIRNFFYGVIFSCCTLSLLFILFYNYESFIYMLQSLQSNYRANMVYVIRGENAVSYLDLFLSADLPYLIAPFIIVSAYRDKNIRFLLWLGWVDILILYCAYAFGHRGGAPIAVYLYVANTFFIVALASYYGKICSNKAEHKNFKKILCISVALFLTMFIAIRMGIHFKRLPFMFFNSNIPVPMAIKFIPVFLPTLVVLFITVAEFKQKFLYVLLSVWFIAIWGGMTTIGKINQNKTNYWPLISFLFEDLPVINQVPNQVFSIYVKKWMRDPDWYSKLLWPYFTFFNQKYPIGPDRNKAQQVKNIIENSIKLYTGKASFLDGRLFNHSKTVLTDSPEEIDGWFPNRYSRSIVTEHNNVTYYVLQQKTDFVLPKKN